MWFNDKEPDHIAVILPDGTPVYEDGWDPKEDFVRLCELHDECEDCPAYGDTCDGRGEEDEE